MYACMYLSIIVWIVLQGNAHHLAKYVQTYPEPPLGNEDNVIQLGKMSACPHLISLHHLPPSLPLTVLRPKQS